MKKFFSYIREIFIGIFSVSLIIFFICLFALLGVFFCWLGSIIFNAVDEYLVYVWYAIGGSAALCIIIGIFFPKRIIEIMEG